MTRTRRLRLAAAMLALLIAVAGVVWFVALRAKLSFRVDDGLRPSIETVEALDGQTQQRRLGVLAEPDGSTAELVLDEAIVHVATQADLIAFLGRWNGVLLDSFPPDEDGQDHLVRVDVDRADPATLVDNLRAVEPHQTGEHRVSDERVLRLLALAAAEWRTGTEVVIDWVSEPASIEDGNVNESSDITENKKPKKNVFDWAFMRTGGALDIGVGAAWQLLQIRGRLTPSVRYMVVDGGFSPNFDFPSNSKIYKASWGDTNPMGCGDNPCTYHGTDVVLAGMGKVGNGYGTAGPAGPVVSQLIAVGNSLDYWSIMRRIESIAEEQHPDVVNLSFGNDVNAGVSHTKKWTDRRMKHVQDTGALIVAAAGNSGKSVDSDTLWIPCESTYVMCVGGVNWSATVSKDSNYGEGDSPTSVEIYGPMCVHTINDPNRSALDFTTHDFCGTSGSSPFVGGVAALVMAANPGLGPQQVRDILNDTAHVGGLGAKVTGSQRRVNALAAVAKALGVVVGPPKLVIETPTAGKQLGVKNWVDLRGKATDFMGRAVPIQWSSDRAGVLAKVSKTSVPPLDPGNHVITATATDTTGRSTSARVNVTVVDTPPHLAIVSPPSGLEVAEGSIVPLVATSMDPDTNMAVPSAETKWEVLRSGSVVFTATGQKAFLPSTKTTPGSYTARFSAGGVTVHHNFTVTDIPPGQSKPVATITKPASTLLRYAHNGAPQSIAFIGTGTDAQDGTVAGTRFKWVAYSATQVKVLCQGSNVPHSGGPGGIVTPKSCASFTASLGLATGEIPSTTWTVYLEVYDSTGLAGVDTVDVVIQYVTG